MLASLFSCELEGSIASLLAAGVVIEGRFEASIELDLVVSFSGRVARSCLADVEAFANGEEAGPLALVVEAFEKKPKMLCCLPVETVPDFLDAGAGLAGVRAVADFSPIVLFNAVNSEKSQVKG